MSGCPVCPVHWHHGEENMATSLLNLLKPKQYKSSLRKKVIACIGALSSVLADRQLDCLASIACKLIPNLYNDTLV
eukprot:2686825-Amphidinium_carterae.1